MCISNHEELLSHIPFVSNWLYNEVTTAVWFAKGYDAASGSCSHSNAGVAATAHSAGHRPLRLLLSFLERKHSLPISSHHSSSQTFPCQNLPETILQLINRRQNHLCKAASYPISQQLITVSFLSLIFTRLAGTYLDNHLDQLPPTQWIPNFPSLPPERPCSSLPS